MQVWVRPCKEAAQKAESQRSIARTMAPFTRLIQADEYRQIATLSCIAYYECVFHFSGAMTPTNTKEDPTGGQQLSIGLACALFPLRKRRPGFDNNSFGYHSDGRFYHGSRNFLQMGPTFKIGDIIGCGIIYPPLGKHCGKIFFTKNGGLVTMLDIGVGGLLGLPWFPVVVSGFLGFLSSNLLVSSFFPHSIIFFITPHYLCAFVFVCVMLYLFV